MARRLRAIPRKKGGTQLSLSRAKRICALVPKSHKKSDDDESESGDEFQQIPIGLSHVHNHVTDSDSSPAPSLLSSIENLNLVDMFIALYRTDFRDHRWYLPLVSQILDICINNSWVLYRRHSVGKTMPLKIFRYQVAQSLLKKGRGDEVENCEVSGPTPSKIIQAPVAPRPPADVRYEKVGHFPIFGSKGRCEFCVKGQTTVMCTKRSLRL